VSESKQKSIETSSSETKVKKQRRFTKRLGRVLRSKKLWALIFIVAVAGGSFKLGMRYQTNHGGSSSKVISLHTTKLTTPPQAGTSRTAPSTKTTTPTTGTTKAGAAKRPIPLSSGHITLVGTVEAATSDTIDIKTTNGQVESFSVSDTTVVMPHTTKSGVKDIKKGTQAALSISVRSDGSFVVLSVRTY